MWKYAKLSFSSIDMESTADYITGGMVTSALGSRSSRVLSTDKDPTGMGRWSELLLTGKKQTMILLFTRYCCVHSNGDASAWTNEKIFMKDQQSAKSANPQKQFIIDLMKCIKE
jgi:hypothetical protein